METINDNIFRIKVPFEDIYTTVFIIKTKGGSVIFDTATYDSDVDEYILPAIEKAGVKEDVKCVFLSHSHRDHAGGLERFMQIFPDARVLTRSQKLAEKHKTAYLPNDREVIFDVLEVVTINGHSDDCMAIFDRRSGTLLTDDCLQVYGVFGRGAWGSNITDISGHFHDLEKLKTINIKTLIASHDYHPLGYIAREDEVIKYIDTCKESIYNLRKFCNEHKNLDDEQLKELYNSTHTLPTVSERVFKAIKNATF